ncbi:MAG: di-heme oxidoredictase family protein [Myxococcota bacterium]
MGLEEELQGALDIYERGWRELRVDALDPGEMEEDARLGQSLFEDPSFPLDLIFVFGDETFELERGGRGFGNGLVVPPGGARAPPNLRRVHFGAFGAPEGSSCLGCHSRGGLNGAGTRTQNILLAGDGEHASSALERNPPHVLGLGPVAKLAEEMTTEIQANAASAIDWARQSGEAQTVSLTAKGIDFGSVVAFPDGTLDTSGLQAIDHDLVVKPFGWKGNLPTLRFASDQAFSIHFGLQSDELINRAKLASTHDVVGPPEPNWFDPDQDGVQTEVSEGQLSSLETYFSLLEIPLIAPPEDETLLHYWSEGARRFDEFGCLSCHAALRLQDPVLCVGRVGGRPGRCVDLRTDSEAPQIAAVPNTLGQLFPLTPGQGGYEVALFSDLRRHDMGPDLAEPQPDQGVAGRMWLTRPLWGLADTAPYLHDGRASDVDEAIRWHGGEAAPARQAYVDAEESQRAALRVFLMSLTREAKILVQ